MRPDPSPGRVRRTRLQVRRASDAVLAVTAVVLGLALLIRALLAVLADAPSLF